MPLLKRREFKPLKPPDDLDPDEEVFVCRLTNEVFRDYDDFFKRTILCNSLVWSCSLTSRPGLTYQEALESEERARKLLASFPVYLEAPILFLVTLTRRGRLADICDDIFVFARDRYFVGEIVDVSYRGNRETCRVEKVIPPGDYGKQLLAEESPAAAKNESNEVMIVGENGEVTEVVIIQDEKAVPKTPKLWKPKTLQPSGYKYEVLSLQGSGRYKVAADKVSRKKGLYTRDKNKLYLKKNCQIIDMQWNVKPEVANKYNLKGKKFSDFFAGPIPNFASTPSKRNRSDGKKFEDEDDLPLTEVKKKEAKLKKKEKSKEKVKKEKTQAQEDKPKKPRLTPEEREAIKQKLKDMKLQEKQKRLEEKLKERDLMRQKKLEEKAAKKEEVRRAAEEDKEKRKKEREQLRLEKQKMEEYLKEWNKPREDLECDDLKDLPKPNPVKCKIPQKLFGDAMMLMEFLYAFGDQLSVQEEFPEGVTLETIEEALFSHQVDGALYDLLKLLLSNIFHLQDEEEEDEKVDLKEQAGNTSLGDIAEILNEDDPTYAALSKAASSALIWPQIHQGTPLRNLPLESTTISEVLRLHLLASGAETSVMDARWRYQQRGAYTFHDDPGLELRLKEPSILKALTSGNVYDLSADSRMMIINTLCNQILSYVTMRDIVEESWDQWQVTKKEWKEICRLEKLREKEESAMKYKRKMEERARAQFRLMEEQRKMQEQAEEAKKAAEGQSGEPEMDTLNVEQPQINGDIKDQIQLGQKNTIKPPELLPEELGEELSPEEKEERQKKEEAESAAKKVEFLKQKEEYEKNLTEFSTRYSVTPVGLDRIFRRYWIFQSVPGLFVEFDKDLMDGMDSLILTKETVEGEQDEGTDEDKDDQDSSDVSEDSNKENNGEVKVNGDCTQKDVKDSVLSNQENEENKLPPAEVPLGVEVSNVKNEDPVEPMEVTEDQEKCNIKEALESKEVKQEDKKDNERMVNGMMEEREDNANVDGSSGEEVMKEVPQSPIKGKAVAGGNSASSEEDTANQDLVPWAYYHKTEELDALLDSLNSRGFRERALKSHISQQREKISQNFAAFPENYLAGIVAGDSSAPWSAQKAPSTPRQVVIKMTSGKKGLVSNQADGDETLELLLREAILDLEDRVWQGGLGIIKVEDRAAWIAAIEQGSYDRQCSEISWGPLWARSLMDDSDFLDMSISEPSLLEDSKKSAALKLKDRVSELKKSETPTGSPANTRCSTPTITDNVVRDMACALLQICQGLHDKYLIKPLGIHEEVKRPRSRKIIEQEEEEEEEKSDEGEEKKPKKTCRECWEESLMASTSLSQVFLHLSTLEQSILWSKSILNARCRICRRKGDAEAMLLCDYCDRGHHMYCLKPPLKNVPKGDWFCKDCTPKAVKRTPRKQRRSTFDEEAEEKVEEEEDEEEDSDSEDSSEDEEEEDDEEDDDDEEEEDGEEEENEEEEEDEEEEDEDEEEDEEEEHQKKEEEEREVEKVPEVKVDLKRGRTRTKPTPTSTKVKPTKAAAVVKERVTPSRGRRGGRKKDAEELVKPESEDGDDGESSEDDLTDRTILTSKDAYYTCYICRHGGQLLTCVGCEGAVHMGCLEAGQLKKGEQWCCDTCSMQHEPQEGEAADTSQHGAVCIECGHGGKLIFCSTCSCALHLGCCSPPLSRMPRKDWQCVECKSTPQEAVVGKTGKQRKGRAAANKTPEVASRSSRRRTQELDSEVHTVKVDEEITLNISDDGRQLKKSLREVRQESQRSSRGRKRTRSAEEDADTEEEEEAKMMPSKKKSLTVVLTRQDKELRKLVSQNTNLEGITTSRRRSSTTGRGSSDMHQLGVCEQLLKELVRHSDAGPFMVPVSKKTVPDYYRIIKRPMDFATMQSKVATMQYAAPVEFISDLRLIFTNCQQYNRYNSYEAKKGRKMWAFLEQRIEELGLQTEGAVNKRKDFDSPSDRKEETNSSSERKRARRKKVITDL